ncbi:MAG: acetyl-CoA carboxylase biotin carboxyl carrier protein subunit [Chitinophagaceae bacterium]
MEENNGNLIYVKAGAFEFRIDPAEVSSADIISTGENAYHIIDGHASRHIYIASETADAKRFRVEAHGESFDILIKDPLDQMLDNMGFTNTVSRIIKDVKAPMPGVVLDINISEGDELEEGQRILILEAMKMENSIVMHAKGKVKKVNVKKGQAVEKNQVLIELE